MSGTWSSSAISTTNSSTARPWPRPTMSTATTSARTAPIRLATAPSAPGPVGQLHAQEISGHASRVGRRRERRVSDGQRRGYEDGSASAQAQLAASQANAGWTCQRTSCDSAWSRSASISRSPSARRLARLRCCSSAGVRCWAALQRRWCSCTDAGRRSRWRRGAGGCGAARTAVASCRPGQLEGHAAGHRPLERGVAPAAPAEPEGTGLLVDVEVEAPGRSVEPGGDTAQQPGARRPEHPEPEPFDIARTRGSFPACR